MSSVPWVGQYDSRKFLNWMLDPDIMSKRIPEQFHQFCVDDFCPHLAVDEEGINLGLPCNKPITRIASYAERLHAIQEFKKGLIQLDISMKGGDQKTAGWSPSGNFKLVALIPDEAAVISYGLSKGVFDHTKQLHQYLDDNPAFDMRIRR